MTIKKICFYSASNELVAGDAKCMINIVNALDTKEYEVDIISDENINFERLCENWLRKKIPIKYLDTRPKLFLKKTKKRFLEVFLKLVTFYHFRNHLKNISVFFKFFKENKYDILHVNNGGYTGKQAALVAIILAKYVGNIPRIILYIQNVAKPRSILQPTDYLFDYFIIKNCDYIVADSLITKKTLTERLGETKKIITIKCGLNTEIEETEKLDLNIKNKNIIKIGIIGNYEEIRKGHDYFIENIDDEIAKLNFHVFIAGSGSAKRKNDLDRLIKRQKIEHKISFLGFVDNISKFLNSVDFVIMPSLYNESIPYAIMESLRSSKPVLASNVGSHKEVIINEYNGYIYNNKNEFKKYFQLMISDNSKVKIMSLNSYKTYKNILSPKETYFKMIDLYKSFFSNN